MNTLVAKNVNNAELLIKAVKITSLNLKTLHRHLVGQNWFTIHDLIGDYYEKIDEFEDAIVENLMSIGVKDVPVDVDSCCPIIGVKSYTEDEAMEAIDQMFNALLKLSQQVRQDLNIPSSIAPVFDEFENFLQLEANYKIKMYKSENISAIDSSDDDDILMVRY